MLSTLLRQSITSELVRPLGLALREWSAGTGPGYPLVPIDFKVRHLRVKTIETASELKQVLALRRAIFHFEFAKKRLSLVSDKDRFDDRADHLAIFDETSGAAVGVYRLILARGGAELYSASEFELDGFLSRPGRKLELSRACIAPAYRNGLVISLLWKGLAEYARRAQVDYLFGLSSVTTTDLGEIAAIHRYFEKQGLVDLGCGITPRAKYRIEGFATQATDRDDGGPLVPSLLRTYLKAGAKVCSQPVIDRRFHCTDWLTILDMKRLSDRYERRFMTESAPG